MMQCSAHVRAKPEWFDKMHHADIVARWTQEAVAQGLTEAQVRYVLAELAHYAALRDEPTGVEVSAVDGCGSRTGWSTTRSERGCARRFRCWSGFPQRNWTGIPDRTARYWIWFIRHSSAW
ncbi:hypothetical protein GCM10017668_01330 [Streptomyces tuirus]|uniref:Uncharacterized protein n=1 Tax=Streptomyces tuirus TaxID=68278 RepID=A0A7G1N9E3_9ACTN|nr:hypothetical protein GCM10017668_01330 [Streptomyces tuirus]